MVVRPQTAQGGRPAVRARPWLTVSTLYASIHSISGSTTSTVILWRASAAALRGGTRAAAVRAVRAFWPWMACWQVLHLILRAPPNNKHACRSKQQARGLSRPPQQVRALSSARTWGWPPRPCPAPAAARHSPRARARTRPPQTRAGWGTAGWRAGWQNGLRGAGEVRRGEGGSRGAAKAAGGTVVAAAVPRGARGCAPSTCFMTVFRSLCSVPMLLAKRVASWNMASLRPFEVAWRGISNSRGQLVSATGVSNWPARAQHSALCCCFGLGASGRACLQAPWARPPTWKLLLEKDLKPMGLWRTCACC